MEDLAPQITRQRLLVEGHFTRPVDEAVIREFLAALPQALDLRVYGEPTIFAPGGAGREENEGYDAFVPLVDSGISLYVWTGASFLALVLFTCKRFDAGRALARTREFFAMTSVASQEF